MAEKRKTYIYKITCKPTNKIYIGRTVGSLGNRLSAHFSSSKYVLNNTPLYEDMKKYHKSDFKIETVYDFYAKNLNEADEIELSFIEKYNAFAPNGYNLRKIKTENNKIIYNLEDFCIEQIFRPYASSFDHRIWQGEYDRTITFNEKIEFRKLKTQYEKYIKQDLLWYPEEVDFRPKLKKEIFTRLKEINFRFYEWLEHPFIDWISKGLSEVDNGKIQQH